MKLINYLNVQSFQKYVDTNVKAIETPKNSKNIFFSLLRFLFLNTRDQKLLDSP